MTSVLPHMSNCVAGSSTTSRPTEAAENRPSSASCVIGFGRTGVEVHDPSRTALLGCVAAVAVITALLQWVLLTYTDSSVAGWDALTTALSLVAQFMLSRKWIANWWFWIAADLVYVPLYAHKELWLTAALYVLFLALCVAGLVQWRAARRKLERQDAEPVAA